MRVLSLFLLFATFFAVGLGEFVYQDESGRNHSHPLVDGKPITVNRVLKPLSNGALFSAGLPPRSPRFVLDAHAKRKASPVQVAPRQVISQVPPPPLPSPDQPLRIVVSDAFGVPMGFVDTNLNTAHCFQITSYVDIAATFYLPTPDGSGYYDILVQNQAYPYIGIATGNLGTGYGQTSPSYGFVTPVSGSDYPYSYNDNIFNHAGESTIWQIDPVTLDLSAFWQSAEGDRIPLTIFHDFTTGSLDLTVGLDYFYMRYGEPVESVGFTLAPIV
ncbi:hypothetical protein SISNIDRAFT_494042 [Sistotremastrum niveocremeum HHB9708]|uniref:Uncharacterized protein n=1 Tax=Sistotremastrum niveocremeum HHB9708 TaxID=1314777 RepID=A0A164X8N0_9AGAM|nr:hypothetical protein SISNIDRAFT_494042 [Sistotremastrum niveocremeum HHB9708]